MSDFTRERPEAPGKYKYRRKSSSEEDVTVTYDAESGELMVAFMDGHVPIKLDDVPFGGSWKLVGPEVDKYVVRFRDGSYYSKDKSWKGVVRSKATWLSRKDSLKIRNKLNQPRINMGATVEPK